MGQDDISPLWDPASPMVADAPFNVPAQNASEAWRELQRRRNLIRMVETLAHAARDEGYMSSMAVLMETAETLRKELIRPALAGALDLTASQGRDWPRTRPLPSPPRPAPRQSLAPRKVSEFGS